ANRLLAGRRKKTAARTGTGRKRVGSVLLMVYVALAMEFGGWSISSGILRSFAAVLDAGGDSQGRLEISSRAYRELETAAGEKDPAKREPQVRTVFLNHAEASPERRERRAGQMWEHFRQRGMEGFAVGKEEANFLVPELRAWQMPERKAALLRAVGMVLVLLAAWRFFISLGSANQDLGKVEWHTEWFFTFPVSSRHLFAAQMLGQALVDPLSWLGAFPFLLVFFVSSGIGWSALPVAFCGTLYLAVGMAALRVTAETWLRLRLASAQLKNLQALFTLLGIAAMLALFLLGRDGAFCDAWVEAARRGSSLWTWNPFSLPCGLGGVPLGIAAALQTGLAGGIVAAAAWSCARLVRGGLVTASGAYLGKRGASKPSLEFLSGGIIGKDIRLLLRDRNFLMQTLVVPVLVVVFQVVVNGSARSFGSNFQNAAAFAYGLGAYVLIATALSVLSVEGSALWMLYTLPVPLYRIIARKTLLWAGCALLYAVAVLGIFALRNPALRPADLVYAAMACAGVVIYAFIASGIGMLGTDPLETEVRRRIRPGSVYLYMILSAMFGYALYAPSAWARIGQLVLSSLLAYALWQKVRDRSPYLLDPVAAPPRRVELADGLIASLAFFVLQGVITLIALAAKVEPGKAITLAFILAGFLVVLFTLGSFWGHWKTLFRVGFTEREGWGRSLGIGISAGIGAGVFGGGYLAAVPWFPALERLRAAAPALPVRGGWLVLLAVVAAPLAEEFIFRGLVFGGLRRSLPMTAAVLGSAAIFAVCHPAFSALPVFVMGMFAALSFECTGRWVTPIAVHMVYNALMLLVNRWI
ncbi:MAG: type II CAAX endopeptidase family protein, partial [Chthoniobacteraceae bacterium]|nr:type II CAAX endopeptidase family protein [Chthoniobacteraceae bacterium]